MIQVDLVTPLKKLVEGALVSSVKLPGSSGELEILPGHTELLTTLRPGVCVITGDLGTLRFAISYGFAEVRKDKVIILAETCEKAKEIDLNRAKEAEKRAQSTLTSVLTPEQFRKQELKLQRSLARQKAVSQIE